MLYVVQFTGHLKILDAPLYEIIAVVSYDYGRSVIPRNGLNPLSKNGNNGLNEYFYGMAFYFDSNMYASTRVHSLRSNPVEFITRVRLELNGNKVFGTRIHKYSFTPYGAPPDGRADVRRRRCAKIIFSTTVRFV